MNRRSSTYRLTLNMSCWCQRGDSQNLSFFHHSLYNCASLILFVRFHIVSINQFTRGLPTRRFVFCSWYRYIPGSKRTSLIESPISDRRICCRNVALTGFLIEISPCFTEPGTRGNHEVPISITTRVWKTEAMNAQDHLMNSISHYEMTSKSCFPGMASAPPKPHFYAPWFFDLPSDNKFNMEMDGNGHKIWISSINGQQMPKVSNRCRCWIYNCTQILCDCKSTSPICSSTASEKTRTGREPDVTKAYLEPLIDDIRASKYAE